MLKSIVRALLKVLFRVRVEGDTSHFSRPRLLIIANHQSFLDGLILGAFLPVVIFPERRITITGSLMKVCDGPAFIAARTQAVIAPVWLDSAARTFFSRLSGSNPRELLPRITVSIQPSASNVMPKDGNGRMRRRKAGEGMRKIMQEIPLLGTGKVNYVRLKEDACRAPAVASGAVYGGEKLTG